MVSCLALSFPVIYTVWSCPYGTSFVPIIFFPVLFSPAGYCILSCPVLSLSSFLSPFLLDLSIFVLFCTLLSSDAVSRRKIRLLEGNAEFRHLKKLTCKGILRQVFIRLRPKTLYHPPPFPYTLYQCLQHTYSVFTQGRGGRGGRVEPERRGEGQQFTKVGLKIPK